MSHCKLAHANPILRKMRFFFLFLKPQPIFGSSHTMIHNVDLRFGFRRNRGVRENRRPRSRRPWDGAVAALAPARSLRPTGPGRARLPESAHQATYLPPRAPGSPPAFPPAFPRLPPASGDAAVGSRARAALRAEAGPAC